MDPPLVHCRQHGVKSYCDECHKRVYCENACDWCDYICCEECALKHYWDAYPLDLCDACMCEQFIKKPLKESWIPQYLEDIDRLRANKTALESSERKVYVDANADVIKCTCNFENMWKD